MVVQLGLAMMPLGGFSASSGLTSLTTSGTSGSLRQAEELSITTAPAAATLGANSRDMVAPADIRAMSRPAKSAVAVSSTVIGTPLKSSCLPADRAELKKRIEWVQDKIFLDGQLAVIVKKLPFFRPKYSIEIGTMVNDRPMRFINIETSGTGRIEMKSITVSLQNLVMQAEQYILEEAQKTEDIAMAYKIEKEQRSMGYGKQETRVTGKTERDRQKKKQKLSP